MSEFVMTIGGEAAPTRGLVRRGQTGDRRGVGGSGNVTRAKLG